jgi:hypothetical protein
MCQVCDVENSGINSLSAQEKNRRVLRREYKTHGPCSFPGCDKLVRVPVSGLCSGHYNQKRLKGVLSVLGSKNFEEAIDLPFEKWKQHPEIPIVFVSNMGRLKRFDKKTGKHFLIKQCMIKNANKDVRGGIYWNGRVVVLYTAFLVAKLFIPREKHYCLYDKSPIVYRDGNRMNCTVSNLQYYDESVSKERRKVLISNTSDFMIQCKKLLIGDSHALDKYIIEFEKSMIKKLCNEFYNSPVFNKLPISETYQDSWLRFISQLKRGIISEINHPFAYIHHMAKRRLITKLKTIKKMESGPEFNDELYYKIEAA